MSGKIFSVASVALAVYAWVSGMFNKLLVLADSLVAMSFGSGPDFTPLTFVNYFFPLDLCLSFLAAWLGVFVAAAALRIVKSFIPSIA